MFDPFDQNHSTIILARLVISVPHLLMIFI